MRRVKITIRISRYQNEKKMGQMWRIECEPGETFMQYRKRILKEKKDK
jgi:hypothetical protein